jgi:hypothetical protein
MNLTEALWCVRDFADHADEDSFHAQAVTHDGEHFSVMVWDDYVSAEDGFHAEDEFHTVDAYLAGRTRFVPERVLCQPVYSTITLDQVKELTADWKSRDIPHDDEWKMVATSSNGQIWRLLIWRQGEGADVFMTAEDYYAGVGKYVREATT